MNYDLLCPKVAAIDAATPGLTDQQIADLLNDSNGDHAVAENIDCRITLRTVADVMVPDDDDHPMQTIIRLEAFAAMLKEQLPAIYSMLTDYSESGGVSVGKPSLRAALQSFVGDGDAQLRESEAAALAAMGMRRQSWTVANGCSGLEARHVADARTVNGEG